MTKNYGIEESKLTDKEIINYVNSTINIDYDSIYTQTVLDIIEAYVDCTGDVSLEYMDDYF